MVYAFTIDSTTFPAAKVANIGQIVSLALPLALTGAALVFLVVTLKAAFDILTNGNNPEALTKAYHSIVMAILGLIIVVGSFLAIKILEVTLNTSIIPK
jgi:succinate dehydrogenase hydrophobic anchor subunit